MEQNNIQEVMNAVVPGWRFVGNYSAEAGNGRIVVAWDPIISVIIYFSSPQLVLCGVLDPRTGQSFTAAFVYARNRRAQRLELWNIIRELAGINNLRDSPWILMGDYNQVLSSAEIFSSSSVPICQRGLHDFSVCLEDTGLFDLAFRGCQFTWYSKSTTSPKSRKIDRALVNESWVERYPDSYAFFDTPGSSDHTPCLISLANQLSPRRCRFIYFTMFSTHPDYQRLIGEAWSVLPSSSSSMSCLYQKLRSVKACCKSLNRNSFSNIQVRAKEARTLLDQVQLRALSDPSVQIFEEESEARESWMFYANAEESFLHQKSRVRWLSVGDLNTGVFHKYVRAHLSRNVIHYLYDNMERKIFDSVTLKSMTVQFYKDLLGSANTSITPFSVDQIRTIHPFRCSQSLADKLVALPTAAEIKSVVFDLPRNKAPGPDGFSVEFFVTSWDLVGSDLVAAVKDFFINPSLSRQVNSTVISLLPKVPGAAKLSQFRPISLCNTVYKVIAKIIGARLKLITPLVVQRNQVGFVKGRLLCENVLLASELVADFNKPGRTTRGCLQIDITKAYDNVDWNFMLNILEAFNLPGDFISWIRSCISSPHYSVAFNGELVGFFPGKKGLRQGDPISSSLFVMAMDILSKNLDAAAQNRMFTPHPKGRYPLVTHLCFADDMLIFFDGSEDSIQAIMQVLNTFYMGSGLGLNLSKTGLFLDGQNHQAAKAVADRFGCSLGILPVRYLGVPLMPHNLRPQDYQPLVDRVRKKITSWAVRKLSFAGRLVLIQSVLYGMFNFWASVFPLPKGCIDAIERLCNAFLWSGGPDSARGAKVSWEAVCTPKSAGGLGLRRLEASNTVFGLKLIWLLFAATGSLWVAWVKEHLLAGKIFWTADFDTSGSWLWRRLMKLRPIARPFLVCRVHTGLEALFWHDDWTGLGPLIDISGANGPRVLGLTTLATVSEAISGDSWVLPRGRHRITQTIRACLPLNPPDLNPAGQDIFLWRNSPESEPAQFNASKTWATLNPAPPSVAWHKSVWPKVRIPKHAFLAWVVILNRLPTRDRLRHWGLSVPANCLLCGRVDECRDHIFFQCSFSQEVWSSFFNSTSFTPPIDFEAAIDWLRTTPPNIKVRNICNLLTQAIVYVLWRERNSRLHSSTRKPSQLLVKEIKGLFKAKLFSLDRGIDSTGTRRPQQPASRMESYLQLWFTHFSA